MITPRDIAAAKEALGAHLAALRRATEANQHALATLVFTSRSSIANIERGRQLGTRDFWQRCDDVLRANGALIWAYDELRALETQAVAYVAASKLASKAGDGQLAWLAADRAATAARLADATAVSAVAAYQAACALLRLRSRLSDAKAIAVAAAADIGPTATGD